MATDSKQTVSWIYELNKDELIDELEKRELSITGNFAVLRQRLLQAVRSTAVHFEQPPIDSGENLEHSPIKPIPKLKAWVIAFKQGKSASLLKQRWTFLILTC